MKITLFYLNGTSVRFRTLFNIFFSFLLIWFPFEIHAQLVEYSIFPDNITKVYRTRFGGIVKITEYTDELGGSSVFISNKGVDLKEIALPKNLNSIIIENIFNKINQTRLEAGLSVLTRNTILDEVANDETKMRFQTAVKFHQIFPPDEFKLTNDSLSNTTSIVGNYHFECGNNSSVIEVDRTMLKTILKNLKYSKPIDISTFIDKIVEELWLGSRNHKNNLMNSYVLTGVGITAANYSFKDYYFDETGKKHSLNSRHSKKQPLGILLFITQVFSIYDEL